MTTAPRPVAIVTGGRRGIGLGIAKALAAEGFDIAVTGIGEADATTDTMLADLEALGARAIYLKGDLADVSGHAATVAAIEDRLGAIGCLVNNAGIASVVRGDFLDLAPENFDTIVATNLRGTVFFTQAVLKAMLHSKQAAGPRSIINITSTIGVWAVLIALAAAILTLIVCNFQRFGNLRESLDAGANSSVLPIITVASLVGFGAVVAAMPAFELVRDAVLKMPGGPLVSLVVAMNTLAALTGTASGGMAIALGALGNEYMRMAAEYGINPELMHRLTVISAGTLDALPHNGTVLLLLQISKQTHSSSYLDMVMTVIVSVIISLVAVFALGATFGSF